MRVTLIGCGFVGSVFTTEFMKRAHSGKFTFPYRFVDDDYVDDRNCANQNFTRDQVGLAKAEVMQDLAQRSGYSAEAHKVRLTPENIDTLLDGSVLVVDGVDNLATRQLLWGYAQRTAVPVLHLGISEQGTGRVEWSHPEHNTFGLAPQHTVGKVIKEPVSGVTPPCELARLRGTGLGVGFCGAVAAAMFFGFDAEAHYDGASTAGLATEWLTSPSGWQPRRETWGLIP